MVARSHTNTVDHVTLNVLISDSIHLNIYPCHLALLQIRVEKLADECVTLTLFIPHPHLTSPSSP